MTSSPVERLRAILARLRDPQGGCPWDVAQTFQSIAPHTLEEAYEVVEAIERGSPDELRDELGDLLLQVIYHARMAEEAGLFDFDAVAEAIGAKLIRRHPHVFGDDPDAAVPDAAAQTRAWENLKARERKARAQGDGDAPVSALAGIASTLPALTRAHKLGQRAARVGFDWPTPAAVLEKLDEEVQELQDELTNGATPDRVQDEMGDLLFVVVQLSRKIGIEPETALRHANAKFERRFSHIEAGLAARGQTPATATMEEMEDLWRDAKRRERSPTTGLA
ncbi:nucleoside triphosphate pyrophosphohydrolase [Pararhodospirillum oryzae]|uniref:Nucleoside triphosphate pyrophosphohydrolase n=1 Tax=Pararhodospirillum oryzae TaxID=478448 RepID=A0A512H394_9PROT|nr:nucleoside triphosphate pyrophosphohydrolase [Pararhodospirillum oryzae]GEO79925.1 nucleoside triphosphate pyrophosphohydrolase [Pararhodospirillum oryzae]